MAVLKKSVILGHPTVLVLKASECYLWFPTIQYLLMFPPDLPCYIKPIYMAMVMTVSDKPTRCQAIP